MCGKIHYMRFCEHQNENRSVQFKDQFATGWMEIIWCFGVFLVSLEIETTSFQFKIQCFFVYVCCFSWNIPAKHLKMEWIFWKLEIISICWMILIRKRQNIKWLNVLFTYRETGFLMQNSLSITKRLDHLWGFLRQFSSDEASLTLICAVLQIKIRIFMLKFIVL